MGRAQNLLIVEHDYLPKYWIVFRKTNFEPYILRQEITNLEELSSLELCGRRSAIMRFYLANFSKFFCGESYVKYFGELLVDLIEFDTCKEICYLFIFLES